MMQGIDISGYQPANTPELVECDFVFVKVTGGIGFVNPRLQDQVASARRAGKKLGAYHFARDGWTGTTADDEAAWFLRHCPAGVLPVLDWEADNSWDVAWAARWLDIVTAATGTLPLIYMNHSVASSHDWNAVAQRHKLWLALYGDDRDVHGYMNLPAAPPVAHWDTPALWQYTQKGHLPGYAGQLDLNVMYDDVWQQAGSAALTGRDLITGLGGLST